MPPLPALAALLLATAAQATPNGFGFSTGPATVTGAEVAQTVGGRG